MLKIFFISMFLWLNAITDVRDTRKCFRLLCASGESFWNITSESSKRGYYSTSKFEINEITIAAASTSVNK